MPLHDCFQPVVDTATQPDGGKVWRSALAWQVTMLLDLNSTNYYVVALAALHPPGCGYATGTSVLTANRGDEYELL